jgi:Fur family transcriptional regulator, stress-responsive regulator
MDSDSRDPIAALRRVGLRVTASRLAVLSALATGAPHASADALVGAVRERLGDGSAQTVYNVLRTLADVGLVRRIEPAGQPGLYELRVGDNHHHIVCRSCGAVADVACAVGEAPCLTAAETLGYEIDEAEVIYWGRCPACIARVSVSSDVPSPPPSVGHHLQGSNAPWRPEQPPSAALHHQKPTAEKGKGKDERV